MPSRALHGWETTRRRRMEQLFIAHAAVSPKGPGRRWGTQRSSMHLPWVWTRWQPTTWGVSLERSDHGDQEAPSW
jgi:hypothetical protein